MSVSDWQQIRDLFEEALQLPPKDRSAFLNVACGSNQEIKVEVEKLLQADFQSGQIRFLDNPIWEWEDMEQSNSSKQPIELPFTDEDKKKYRVLKLIGRGGMGVVYSATSLDRGDEVAIKVMKIDLSEEDSRRREDERKILVKLDDHQHIVTFLSRGLLSDGRPYFVMKFVKGDSLEECLKNGALPFQQVAQITNQLGKTLAFAHRNRVVHRDIKPSNIMLSELDGGLCVKVLDFGIAILRESEDTRTKDFTQNIICTPAYASPEQLEGKRRDEIDHRSDIFSLGCVVYEMLTGKRPFIVTNQLTRMPEKPTPPSQARPDIGIPRGVDIVLLKAMAKSPEDRYDSAQEFAEEFQLALLSSAPQRQHSRMQKYLLPIAATLLLATGGGLGLHYWNSPVSQEVANINGSQQQANDDSKSSDNENRNGASPVANPQSGDSNSSLGRPAGETQSPKLGMDLRLIQLTASGEKSVPFETVFRSGNAVRWNIKPMQAGYLYIVFKGSSGNVSIFYPRTQDTSSHEQIPAGKNISYPQNDLSIKFDEQPGNETYYFVFATQKGEPVLAELENAVAQRRVALNDSEGQKLINTLQARAESEEPGPLVRILALQHR